MRGCVPNDVDPIQQRHVRLPRLSLDGLCFFGRKVRLAIRETVIAGPRLHRCERQDDHHDGQPPKSPHRRYLP